MVSWGAEQQTGLPGQILRCLLCEVGFPNCTGSGAGSPCNVLNPPAPMGFGLASAPTVCSSRPGCVAFHWLVLGWYLKPSCCSSSELQILLYPSLFTSESRQHFDVSRKAFLEIWLNETYASRGSPAPPFLSAQEV